MVGEICQVLEKGASFGLANLSRGVSPVVSFSENGKPSGLEFTIWRFFNDNSKIE